MIGIMTVVRIFAVAPNRSTAAPTVNDRKVCLDTPASRKQKNIRAVSAAIAIDSRWAAATNIGTANHATIAATTIAALIAAITAAAADARVTGVADGKTSTTSAAATAIRWAARASNAVTTSRATTTRNDTTIRAATVREKTTANAITTTTTATVTDAAATKIAAGGIALQTQLRRGLAMKTPSAVVARTSNANIAGAGRKDTVAPMNASRKTSTIG